MDNQVWFGKYRIIKTLGRGGSAGVYLAEHVKLKSLRAIKKISKDNILHDQLLNEAYILKNLKHPCIPVIYDFEEDANNSYIIEQYIEGISLKEFCVQNPPLKEKTIINISLQICDLLSYLHSLDNPILYLDLQPENIMISDMIVTLIDFGAASRKDLLAKRKYSLGTRGYAAPELYKGHIPDERADIYGIGSLMYFMVTGNNPGHIFKNKIQKDEFHTVSNAFQAIVKRCLRYDKELRYLSITILKNHLLGLTHEKESYKIKSKISCHINIAGTQPRVGVTHMALLITSYYRKKGHDILYMERNPSGQILSLLRRNKCKTENGIYQYKNLSLLPYYNSSGIGDVSRYPLIVRDYGVLRPDNLEEFLEGDARLVVAGAKEWELEHTENSLRLLNEEGGIKYLLNYLDGRQYAKIIKSMGNLECYRIPYEPEAFGTVNNHNLEELINLLISC